MTVTMMEDPFIRTRLLLGEEACRRLRESLVVVVGLGAVGGYAVEGLARAGVGRFRLVDFDVVHATNLNRQLLALASTIDRSKAELAAERVRSINPRCEVEVRKEFFARETAGELLGGGPDLVIDAIDSLVPKVELLATARRMGLRVISTMGAARRLDPTRIRTGLLRDVTGCPLSRFVRKRLRRVDAPLDIPCVYSDEPLPRGTGLPAEGEVPEEAPTLDRGRRRTPLGSLSTITGIFGLTLGHLALEQLLGGPLVAREQV